MILAELTKDTKMNIISLVKNAANQREFLKLAEETLKMSIDEERKEVTGAILIPNQKIYRTAEFFEKTLGIKEDGNIYCTAETIKELAISQLKIGNNINLEHDESVMRDDVEIVESWIINTEEDKTYSMGLNKEAHPIGTWMQTQRINDDELWADVKAGKYNGFSIEASPVLNLIYTGMELNKEYTDDEIATKIAILIKNHN